MSSQLGPVLDSTSDTTRIEAVYRRYATLAETLPLDAEHGLGSKLLYAGGISLENTWQVASSVAGAASIGASADSAVLRQAMRDGAIDFLVTSLEEALRILKNEIRKKQAIAVGVAVAPVRLAEQMVERGVLPDLLTPWGSEAANDSNGPLETLLSWGARQITESGAMERDFVSWAADRRAALWLPLLDACARKVLPPEDALRQRWLRYSPRYLGRLAQKQRGVPMAAEELARFRTEVDAMLASQTAAGEEPVAVMISSGFKTRLD